MKNTIIIFGLGNPGPKFKNTKHNVGFLVLDKFAKVNNFENFELQKKYFAEISHGEINSFKIILIKPQTFMNESGKSAQKIVKTNFAEKIIVVHDDIDLPIGKIRIVKERGSAGHKGVESIVKSIGNKNLIRFRVGVKSATNQPAKKVVLKKFNEQEKEVIDFTISKITEALYFYIKNELEKTMNKYN